MNTTIENSLDYQCFLLGIIVYWMFEAVRAALNPLFFLLEGVLNPIAVVVGENVLFLLVFYFLFRNLKKIDIKWKHVAILLGFLVAMSVFEFEHRSCCGGMLFAITFKYILFACCGIGGNSWAFVPHPILEEVITCLLLVLFTAGSVYLLVKKNLWVLPQAAILAVLVLHFFTANYLYNILKEHLVMNLDAFQYGAYFNNVAYCCNWVFFLAAFVLYRKEMKQQTL